MSACCEFLGDQGGSGLGRVRSGLIQISASAGAEPRSDRSSCRPPGVVGRHGRALPWRARSRITARRLPLRKATLQRLSYSARWRRATPATSVRAGTCLLTDARSATRGSPTATRWHDARCDQAASPRTAHAATARCPRGLHGRTATGGPDRHLKHRPSCTLLVFSPPRSRQRSPRARASGRDWAPAAR